jgi:prepilin-type N-terminal cleavage/methylation domain-containing protein
LAASRDDVHPRAQFIHLIVTGFSRVEGPKQAMESVMSCLQHRNEIELPPGKELIVKRRDRGFSLLEVLVASMIGLIATVMTFRMLLPALQSQNVTTAYNETLTTIRRARDQAAADMRVYVVTFTPPGTITVTQNTTTGPVLLTTVLPQDITFHVEPGLPTSPTAPPTTPDGFGTASNAIDFDQGVGLGGATSIYFQPDGTAMDINGNINNGVVYMGRVGDLPSSRAITLWGSTSRIRGWRYWPAPVSAWRQQ